MAAPIPFIKLYKIYSQPNPHLVKISAMVRTYTGHTGCVSMIFKRHHWGPQTVYQAEKPGVPESETQKREQKE